MCSLSKEQSILSMDTIQNAFFFFPRIMPLFRLRLFIFYRVTHSRALPPACVAVVLYLDAFECNTTSDWLWFSLSEIVIHSNSLNLGKKTNYVLENGWRIRTLFSILFLYLAAFECNTTSD